MTVPPLAPEPASPRAPEPASTPALQHPSTPAAQHPSTPDRQEIKRLAQEFEALLMTEMLRQMRRSMLDDEPRDGFGAGALTDTADVELGRALSRTGGFGLADLLLRAFDRQLGIAPGETTAAPAPGDPEGGAAPAVSGSPETSAPIHVSQPSLKDVAALGKVSSGFGWRRDPITGAPRFHRGIDIAVAYGRDVHAAAGGTVVFAGVQRGYGSTIVVEHSDGRQTRYAHLSQQLVTAGDPVVTGQVLGKSGGSGRGTGPHLHFEVLENGRPVDPSGLEGGGGRKI